MNLNNIPNNAHTAGQYPPPGAIPPNNHQTTPPVQNGMRLRSRTIPVQHPAPQPIVPNRQVIQPQQTIIPPVQERMQLRSRTKATQNPVTQSIKPNKRVVQTPKTIPSPIQNGTQPKSKTIPAQHPVTQPIPPSKPQVPVINNLAVQKIQAPVAKNWEQEIIDEFKSDIFVAGKVKNYISTISSPKERLDICKLAKEIFEIEGLTDVPQSQHTFFKFLVLKKIKEWGLPLEQEMVSGWIAKQSDAEVWNAVKKVLAFKISDHVPVDKQLDHKVSIFNAIKKISKNRLEGAVKLAGEFLTDSSEFHMVPKALNWFGDVSMVFRDKIWNLAKQGFDHQSFPKVRAGRECEFKLMLLDYVRENIHDKNVFVVDRARQILNFRSGEEMRP